MVINIENIKKQILDFLDIKDLKQAKKALIGLKLLVDLIRSIEIKDIPQFGEIFAEVARKHPKYTANNLNKSFQLMLRKRSQPTQEKLYELDRYLIKKYCLFEGETISDSFYGDLRTTYLHVSKGQIFLTNQRIIACGRSYLTSIVKEGPTAMKTKYGYAKENAHQMKGITIRESLFKPAFESGIMTYGFPYPIRNAYKIKRGKSKVQYTINVEYETQGKFYDAKLNVKVTPDKIKGDKERKEEILNNLEKTLIKNQ